MDNISERLINFISPSESTDEGIDPAAALTAIFTKEKVFSNIRDLKAKEGILLSELSAVTDVKRRSQIGKAIKLIREALIILGTMAPTAIRPSTGPSTPKQIGVSGPMVTA